MGNHSRHNSRLVQAVAALVVAAVIAACGNSGDDDAAEQDTPPSTDAPDGDASSGDPELGSFEPIEGVPGVTDDEISFAVMGTGPANPLGYCLLECYQAGVEAYFSYRNELGGVHGRDLVVGAVADDEFTNTQVTLIDLLENDDTFGIFAAPLQYAGFADVGATDVPTYSTFPASPDAEGHDNIYAPSGTICIACINPTTLGMAQLVGATKVASLGFGVSQASKDCAALTKEAIDFWGPAVGVEFVYLNDELPFGFPNGIGPEVTAMKEAGVDFISTCIDQSSALSLEQELHRQGMEDVVVALPQGYGDSEFLSANADLLEDDILGITYRPIEADPGDTIIPTMLEYLEEQGQFNDYAIQGWMSADLAVTGLLEAGPQFDQAGVVSATNQLTDFTAGGLLPGVNWTIAHSAPEPDDERRVCSALLRVRGGELELVGDPAEPFFCWALPMETYEDPTPFG